MEHQQEPRWQPTRRQLLWAVAILAVAVLIGYRFGITLWDWLKLLVVPAVIAGGGLWFNSQQQERQREDNRKQYERGLEIENGRAQDEALQAYLGHMSELLTAGSLNKQLRGGNDSGTHNLRVLGRARTITVLRQLDGTRKGSVLQFLYEANLIRWTPENHEGPDTLSGTPEIGSTGVIDLSGADLGRAELRNARLFRAALGSSYDTPGVYLWYAKLNNSDLRTSLLYKANLGHANLSGAFLSYSDLTEVTAIGANFSGAILTGATLVRAYLVNVDLSGASLTGADLKGADLTGAYEYNSSGTKHLITNEELDQQARSLEGATMPNGQKYEDWLKSRDSGENGDNQ